MSLAQATLYWAALAILLICAIVSALLEVLR